MYIVATVFRKNITHAILNMQRFHLLFGEPNKEKRDSHSLPGSHLTVQKQLHRQKSLSVPCCLLTDPVYVASSALLPVANLHLSRAPPLPLCPSLMHVPVLCDQTAPCLLHVPIDLQTPWRPSCLCSSSGELTQGGCCISGF